MAKILGLHNPKNIEFAWPDTRRSYQPLAVIVLFVLLLTLVKGSGTAARIHLSAGILLREPAETAVGKRDNLTIDPDVRRYLQKEFCGDGLCGAGRWAQWIIVAEDSHWKVSELMAVRKALVTTIRALDNAGLEGLELLSGYRFHRIQRQSIDHCRCPALVHHHAQEVELADNVFKLDHGFYIYHELGHIVDRRLDSKPRRAFHPLLEAGSKYSMWGPPKDPWVRVFARLKLSEATANAIALWVVLNNTDISPPVFNYMAADPNYEVLASLMGQAMAQSH